MDATHLARLIPLLPEILLGCGAMALLMLGVFQGGLPAGRSRRLVDYAAIGLLAVAAIILLLLPAGTLATLKGSHS